jgi:hypothetical protein
MTARSTTTATNEFSRLDRARRSLGCRQRSFILIAQLEQSQQDLIVSDRRPGGGGLAVIAFLVPSGLFDGGYPALLRAGYLPNRGASVTRRELRCPVK